MGFIVEFEQQSGVKDTSARWVPVWFPEHPSAFRAFAEAQSFAREHYRRVGGPTEGWRVREKEEKEEKEEKGERKRERQGVKKTKTKTRREGHAHERKQDQRASS